MEFDNVVVKEAAGVCRCCLSEGCYKDLASEYFWMGEKEIYADMLLDCFDLSISQQRTGPNGMRRLICEVCITRLRDACNFKKQVVESEKRFVDQVLRGLYPNAEDVGESSMMLKSEMKTEPVKMDDDDNEEHIYEEYLDIDDDVIIYSETEDMKKEQLEDDLPLSTMTKARKRVKEIKLPKGIAIKKIKVSTKPTVKKETALAKKASTAAVRRDDESEEEDAKLNPAKERFLILKSNVMSVISSSKLIPFRWLGSAFRCFYCHAGFRVSSQLKEHTSNKHDEDDSNAILNDLWDRPVNVDVSVIACKLCDVEIKDLKHLITHLCQEHEIEYDNTVGTSIFPFLLNDDALLKCLECKRKFKTFRFLYNHTNKHHNSKAVAMCDVCGQHFQDEKKLKNHASFMHREGGYVCKFCNENFDTAGKREYHYKRIHKKKEKPCPKCSLVFPSHYQRRKHMATEHTLVPQIQCPNCPKKFVFESNMQTHVRKHHLKEKNFACEYCGYRTFLRSELKKHINQHFNIRQHQCNLCDKSYVDKKHLRRHLDRHHGVILA